MSLLSQISWSANCYELHIQCNIWPHAKHLRGHSYKSACSDDARPFDQYESSSSILRTSSRSACWNRRSKVDKDWGQRDQGRTGFGWLEHNLQLCWWQPLQRLERRIISRITHTICTISIASKKQCVCSSDHSGGNCRRVWSWWRIATYKACMLCILLGNQGWGSKNWATTAHQGGYVKKEYLLISS